MDNTCNEFGEEEVVCKGHTFSVGSLVTKRTPENEIAQYWVTFVKPDYFRAHRMFVYDGYMKEELNA